MHHRQADSCTMHHRLTDTAALCILCIRTPLGSPPPHSTLSLSLSRSRSVSVCLSLSLSVLIFDFFVIYYTALRSSFVVVFFSPHLSLCFWPCFFSCSSFHLFFFFFFFSSSATVLLLPFCFRFFLFFLLLLFTTASLPSVVLLPLHYYCSTAEGSQCTWM